MDYSNTGQWVLIRKIIHSTTEPYSCSKYNKLIEWIIASFCSESEYLANCSNIPEQLINKILELSGFDEADMASESIKLIDPKSIIKLFAPTKSNENLLNFIMGGGLLSSKLIVNNYLGHDIFELELYGYANWLNSLKNLDPEQILIARTKLIKIIIANCDIPGVFYGSGIYDPDNAEDLDIYIEYYWRDLYGSRTKMIEIINKLIKPLGEIVFDNVPGDHSEDAYPQKTDSYQFEYKSIPILKIDISTISNILGSDMETTGTTFDFHETSLENRSGKLSARTKAYSVEKIQKNLADKILHPNIFHINNACTWRNMIKVWVRMGKYIKKGFTIEGKFIGQDLISINQTKAESLYESLPGDISQLISRYSLRVRNSCDKTTCWLCKKLIDATPDYIPNCNDIKLCPKNLQVDYTAKSNFVRRIREAWDEYQSGLIPWRKSDFTDFLPHAHPIAPSHLKCWMRWIKTRHIGKEMKYYDKTKIRICL